MRECHSTLEIYLLQSYKQTREEKEAVLSPRLSEFLERCESVMQVPTDFEKVSSFRNYVATTFQDKSLLQEILGSEYSNRNSKWDHETRIFTFAMLSLMASGENITLRGAMCGPLVGGGEKGFRSTNAQVIPKAFEATKPKPVKVANFTGSSKLIVDDDDWSAGEDDWGEKNESNIRESAFQMF